MSRNKPTKKKNLFNHCRFNSKQHRIEKFTQVVETKKTVKMFIIESKNITFVLRKKQTAYHFYNAHY